MSDAWGPNIRSNRCCECGDLLTPKGELVALNFSCKPCIEKRRNKPNESQKKAQQLRMRLDRAYTYDPEYDLSPKEITGLAFHMNDFKGEVEKLYKAYYEGGRSGDLTKAVLDFLIHAPNHMVAACEILELDWPTESIFDTPQKEGFDNGDMDP